MRLRIEEELNRTGLSFYRLAEAIKRERSWNVKAADIKAAVEGEGELSEPVSTAILDILGNLPDAPRTTSAHIPRRYRGRNRNYVAITEEMRQALDRELASSRINVAQLCRNKPAGLKGLSPAIVSKWRTGKTLSASREAWDYMTSRLNKALKNRRSSKTV